MATDCRGAAGSAVAADGSLRVVSHAVLYKLTAEGDLVWARGLGDFAIDPRGSGPDYIPEEPEAEVDSDSQDNTPRYQSLPCIVNGCDTLISMQNTAAIVDADGDLVARIRVPLADDSGPAPNVSRDGTPILTTVDGSVLLWEDSGLTRVGHFGYDIVPVAVFDDDSFAVSGYAGAGFCRVRRDGSIVWRGGLKEASFLPTVSRSQASAVGSPNDQRSAIFSPDGALLGTYPHAAVFAEYLDGGWIALSEDVVARLTPSGWILWAHPVAAPIQHGSYQPIVDTNGMVYIVDGNAVVAFDGDGHAVFSADVSGQPGPLFPVRPGTLATVAGRELLFIC